MPYQGFKNQNDLDKQVQFDSIFVISHKGKSPIILFTSLNIDNWDTKWNL